MPGGPILGILAAYIASKNNNGCGGIGVGALLFILPDGLGFTPVQTEKMKVGIYANFLSIDYTNRNKKPFDYAPDFGLRINLNLTDEMFVFSRMSAKYSTVFAGFAAQATVGIGWDFQK